MLINSNVDIIQVDSFVNPQKVPQMADTDELFKIIKSEERFSNKQVKFSGLVLNERGLERAMNVGVDMVCLGVSASEHIAKKIQE